VLLIKIGGGDAINLAGIADDISVLEEPVIVVHGANALRNRLAEQLGVPIRTVTSASGYSSVLTGKDTIELMMMAYAGLRNKQLVELLQRRGVDAIGLCGLDGRVIQGRRNRGIRVRDGGKLKLVRDLSGRTRTINRQLLDLLLDNGYTPVLTMPIADENGAAVNSENDDVMAALHASFHADRVIQLIEAPGLLADANAPESQLTRLGRAELDEWEERAEGRMRRKLRAIGALLDAAPTRVVIGDGRGDHPIQDALDGKGTVIR
jgi:acetylglutamate/LysW-gamma-L-alpha-aminoadipate kinase